MAQIIQLDTFDQPEDKCLVMGYREARQYNLIIGDYTQIEILCLLSMVNASLTPDATLSTLHEGAEASNRDFMWFGLKTSDGLFPGETDVFCGMKSERQNSQPNPPTSGIKSTSNYFGSVLESTSGSLSTNQMQSTDGFFFGGSYASGSTNPTDGIAMTGYLRFVINNRGLSNQSVSIYSGGLQSNTVSLDVAKTGKYTTDILRSLLAGRSPGTSEGSFPLNNGTSAYALPKSIFMYLPFANARLAIHGVAIQVE